MRRSKALLHSSELYRLSRLPLRATPLKMAGTTRRIDQHMQVARRDVVLSRARALVAGAVGLAVYATPAIASAGPQWHLGLSPGGCYVRESDAAGWAWCGSLSGHALFLRTRDRDFGLGPYVRFQAVLDNSVSASAGASALVPLSPTFPFILSAGVMGDRRGGALHPGVDVSLFWGPSSYNFHSSYSMANGLLVGLQRTWGTTPATTLALGAQLDLALAVIPFIALYEVLRGPPER